MWWCALAAMACTVAACSGANVPPSSTVTGEWARGENKMSRLYDVTLCREIERKREKKITQRIIWYIIYIITSVVFGGFCFRLFLDYPLQTCCGPDWKASSSRGAGSKPRRNKCRKNGASVKARSSSHACVAWEWVCRSWTWPHLRVSSDAVCADILTPSTIVIITLCSLWHIKYSAHCTVPYPGGELLGLSPSPPRNLRFF